MVLKKSGDGVRVVVEKEKAGAQKSTFGDNTIMLKRVPM